MRPLSNSPCARTETAAKRYRRKSSQARFVRNLPRQEQHSEVRGRWRNGMRGESVSASRLRVHGPFGRGRRDAAKLVRQWIGRVGRFVFGLWFAGQVK